LWTIVENRDETRRLGAYGRSARGLADAESISSNGRFFLTCTETDVALCDSVTWKLRTIPDWNDPSFSPSGRFLIDDKHIEGDGEGAVGHHRITLFDVQSGERIGSYGFEGTADHHRHIFSRDETICALISASPADELYLEAQSLPDGTRLWRKPVELGEPWSYDFTSDRSLMIAFDNRRVAIDGNLECSSRWGLAAANLCDPAQDRGVEITGPARVANADGNFFQDYKTALVTQGLARDPALAHHAPAMFARKVIHIEHLT
jgi:hypothetical protein